MKQTKILIILFLCFKSISFYAQEFKYRDYNIKQFNIGVSNGVGGMHFFIRPALEIKIGKMSLRGAVGFFNVGGDITYELRKANWELLKKFNKCEANYWTISANYNYMYRPLGETFDGFSSDEFFSVTYGIKTYGSGRLATSIKIGTLLNHHTFSEISPYYDNIKPRKHSYNIIPYADLSLVFYLRKNEKIIDPLQTQSLTNKERKKAINKTNTEQYNEIVKYGIQIEEHLTYPINQNSISFFLQVRNHEFTLGPEYTGISARYVKMYDDYKFGNIGLNVAYKYIIQSGWENFPLFIKIKSSVGNTVYKSYHELYGTEEKEKTFLMISGTCGVNYKIADKVELYGGFGLTSREKLFISLSTYVVHLMVGLNYKIK